MGWGAPFAAAWKEASDAGKAAAAEIATGVRRVGEQGVAAAERALAKVTDLEQWVDDTIQKLDDWVSGEIEEAGDWAEGKVHEAGDWVEGKVHKAEDWAEGKIHGAEDWLEGRIHKAGSWVENKIHKAEAWVESKVQEAEDWVDDRIQGAEDWVAAKAHDAEAWITERVDDLKSAVREVERAAFDKAYDLFGALAERLRQAHARKNEEFPADKVAGSPVEPCPYAEQLSLDQRHDGWVMAAGAPGAPCSFVPPGQGALAQARSKAACSTDPCCQARRAAGDKQRDIIYVNGIQTSSNTACDTLKTIAAQTCGRVTGVYNATDGKSASGFLGDAAQTSQDRRLIKRAEAGHAVPPDDGRNPAVDTLQQQVVSELRAGRKPEIWAHSQGGAVTSLALFNVKNQQYAATGNPDPLGGVHVTSMGSAAPFWPDGPTYDHFVHTDDLTPTFLGLGTDPADDAKRAGKNAKVTRFSGDPRQAGAFVATGPAKGWIPAGTANHDVKETYLRMEKQTNGGCP